MEMQQVSDSCYAVLNEKNRVCDANSGLVNRGGGVVIDTQSDLPHAQRMIDLFSQVWPAMPDRVINTHEDADHVWGNQLFEGADAVFAWLGFVAPIQPGTVMGFGTIPDCTACDHDDFLDPGAEIEITFERLGTLRCRFAEPVGKLLPSRWPVREALQKYH